MSDKMPERRTQQSIVVTGHGMMPPETMVCEEYVLALEQRLAAAEKDAEAGRKLWAYLMDQRLPWSEEQDDYVTLGLLKIVDMSLPDSPQQCDACDGDCDMCYRPTGLLIASPPNSDDQQQSGVSQNGRIAGDSNGVEPQPDAPNSGGDV